MSGPFDSVYLDPLTYLFSSLMKEIQHARTMGKKNDPTTAK